jgi:hypothetical protein
VREVLGGRPAGHRQAVPLIRATSGYLFSAQSPAALVPVG